MKVIRFYYSTKFLFEKFVAVVVNIGIYENA
jgi:hypothetical protein